MQLAFGKWDWWERPSRS